MNTVYAVFCGIVALIASWYTLTGVVKGIAGTSKALFYGAITLASLYGVFSFLAKRKFGS